MLFCPFLSVTILPFHSLKGLWRGQQQNEGPLKEGSWGDPEFGVCGNNQYANCLTSPNNLTGVLPVLWDPHFPLLFPLGGGHKGTLFRLAGGLAESQPSSPHVHTLVSGPLACHFSG